MPDRHGARRFMQKAKEKPHQIEQTKSEATVKLSEPYWCICPKCGAYISARIEHCTCGAKLPKPPTKRPQ